MTDTVLHVGGASPYDVVVGHDLAHHLPALLGPGVERVAVICPDRLEGLVDDLVEPIAELDITVLAVPDGEDAKRADVAEACWEALGEEGFTRSDVVLTVGGGATTDLGGFVAATWLRGVRVVHVPTTLLAMVDAAVGGKTGINTESGKNLVGAFHEPAGVLCDLALLETLPGEELRAGLGEVVKCGFIADPEILRLVEETDPDELIPSSPVLRELVERAIRVKIDVVVADLKETGGVSTARPRNRPRGAQLRTHPGARDRAGGGLRDPARRGGGDRLRLRRRARPTGRSTSRRGGRPASDGLRPGGPADVVLRGVVRGPARRDADRQEGPGQPAALRRPRRPGPAGGACRTVRGRPSGGVRRDRSGLMTTPSGSAHRKVLVLNGPNLRRLGRRQPEIYGTTTYAELAHLCVDWGNAHGLEVEVRQTNHEGELLDWLNEAADTVTPVVLNAAAWTHYSYALFDACAQLTAPLVEVHISAPEAAAGGVPAHLGGHPPCRPGDLGSGHRGVSDGAGVPGRLTVTRDGCRGSLGGQQRHQRRPIGAPQVGWRPPVQVS